MFAMSILGGGLWCAMHDRSRFLHAGFACDSFELRNDNSACSEYLMISFCWTSVSCSSPASSAKYTGVMSTKPESYKTWNKLYRLEKAPLKPHLLLQRLRLQTWFSKRNWLTKVEITETCIILHRVTKSWTVSSICSQNNKKKREFWTRI